MPKMIVSVDGVVIKEVQLTKDRTTLGRRPYNDIVIDNLAVSGEHAVFQMMGSDVYLEDLHSTNGSYVNGKAVSRQLLQNGDAVEVGKCRIKFISDVGADNVAMMAETIAGDLATLTPAALPPSALLANAVSAVVKIVSGVAAGRELPLTKGVTTIGKPGVAVAAITRRQQGFVIHHVEGSACPLLNGAPVGVDPVVLNHGDLIELAGTQMQFVQA